MAFVVEDGTGLADANSYASAAEADAYFLDRGNAAWTGANAVKESALIQATDYIETRFWGKFVGSQLTETQALSWPRTGFDEIPAGIKRACMEYAVRALSAPLAPDPAVPDSGITMATTRQEVVGAVVVEFEPVGSTPMKHRPYPAADALLRRFLVAQPLVIRS